MASSSYNLNTQPPTEVSVNTVVRATSNNQMIGEQVDSKTFPVDNGNANGQNGSTEDNTGAQDGAALGNYDTMLPQFTPRLINISKDTLLKPGVDRTYDKDETANVIMDVQKALDEEQKDTAKALSRKLEGLETKKIQEEQQLNEKLKEIVDLDSPALCKTLIKGDTVKRRSLKESVTAKRVINRKATETVKHESNKINVERNIQETGAAEENCKKTEQQEDRIDKVAVDTVAASPPNTASSTAK